MPTRWGANGANRTALHFEAASPSYMIEPSLGFTKPLRQRIRGAQTGPARADDDEVCRARSLYPPYGERGEKPNSFTKPTARISG